MPLLNPVLLIHVPINIDDKSKRIRDIVKASAIPWIRAEIMCHLVCSTAHPYGALLKAAHRCEGNSRRSDVRKLRERLGLSLESRGGWVCEPPATRIARSLLPFVSLLSIPVKIESAL